MTIEFFGKVLLQADKGFQELTCLQLKIFCMPKWHILGQHALKPFSIKECFLKKTKRFSPQDISGEEKWMFTECDMIVLIFPF